MKKIKANEEVETKLKWYVINSIPGDEDRAMSLLKERIIKFKLEHLFGEMWAPADTSQKFQIVRPGKNIGKYLPGYILIQMEFVDDAINLVTKTPKITRFLTTRGVASPVPPAEVARIRYLVYGDRQFEIKSEFAEGDVVKIIAGPFINSHGRVEEIKPEKQKLRVTVSFFGRATPVELSYDQVKHYS